MSEEGNQFIELWGVTCERLENMSNDHLVLIWQGQERSRPSLSVTIKTSHWIEELANNN